MYFMWLWFSSNTRWGAIILKINQAGYGDDRFQSGVFLLIPTHSLCGVDPPVSTGVLMDDTHKFGYTINHMGLIRLDWSAGGL
jgi:hypothetical protein